MAELCIRPSINIDNTINIVKPILEEVKQDGIGAVIKYAKKFGEIADDNILVNEKDIVQSEFRISDKAKKAIDVAYENIHKFHSHKKYSNYEIETMPGVTCRMEYKAIENTGLYIPGGTAVLPSTMLMLGIPAQISGCERVVASSPANKGVINNYVLYAAKKCGVTEFYKVGGAQAIALMAYGSGSVNKVDKIFGPGNQYVTAAKMLVSNDTQSCTIDMPAGPSELLVIADKQANPLYIAADLLSQAEHGTDSQVVLVTTCTKLTAKVKVELGKQLLALPRKNIAQEALQSSFTLVVNNLSEAVEFCNTYAPEHLIINTESPESVVNKVRNAGSVFLGAYTPESVGDYASGTNHSLPTYGYAKSIGGVSVLSFMKTMTFQSLTKEGLHNIAETVTTLAELETLEAHSNAVKVRLQK